MCVYVTLTALVLFARVKKRPLLILYLHQARAKRAAYVRILNVRVYTCSHMHTMFRSKLCLRHARSLAHSSACPFAHSYARRHARIHAYAREDTTVDTLACTIPTKNSVGASVGKQGNRDWLIAPRLSAYGGTALDMCTLVCLTRTCLELEKLRARCSDFI